MLTLDTISTEIASGVACGKSRIVTDGIPHLRPFSVTADGRLTPAEAPIIPVEAVPANRRELRVGDILFNNTNSQELVGKSAIVEAHLYAAFSNHMTRIRVDTRLAEPGFVHRYLNYLFLKRYFEGRATRWVSQAAFGTSQLKAIEIPLPPLDEQRRIVGLLDRAAEIRRRADAARTKARAIIPALFLDMFGDPAINPKGWEVKTLGNLSNVELRNGISPSKSGTVAGKVLTLSAITRGAFDPTALKESLFAGPLAPEQSVSRSSFLICRGNGNPEMVGRGAFPTADLPDTAFPDTIIALRGVSGELSPAYLSALWATDFMRGQIKAAAKTTNGTFKISQGGIMSFALPIPPLPLQAAFAEKANRLDALARALDAAAAKAVSMAAALSAEVFG